MDEIFYTALVVAIFYSVFSVFSWIGAFKTISKIHKRTKRIVPVKLKPMAIFLDSIALVYWIWMIVRCFTN